MKQILIVDDEPHVRRVLKLTLDKAGYQTDSVSNGEEALAWIRNHQPDVLITDIQMPRMSGEELCIQLQEEMPDRKFPIFVMTSHSEIEERKWISKFANVFFLEKPVSGRRLIEMFGDYFRQQESEQDG